MADFDLFIFFRATLFVFLTTYSLLLLVGGIRRLATILFGSDPEKEFLRLYFSYQLLTVRHKPLRSELTQIIFWLLILATLWWLHTLI